MKLFKVLGEYFPLILDFFNKYKAWGWFVLIVATFSLILSAYSVNGVQEHKDKTDARLSSIQASIYELHEMSIENTAKLEILVELAKEK